MGETAAVPGVEGGELAVTLDGNVYLSGLDPDGWVAVLVWSVENRDTDAPARLAAPIEGGGWRWVTPDGEALDFYNDGPDEVPWWGAGVNVMHAEPIMAGTSERGLVNEVVVPEPGGTVAYVSAEGDVLASWAVPDKRSGKGFEKVLEVVGAD